MTAPFTDAEMDLNPPNRFWDPQVLADTCNALRACLREAERQRDEARAALETISESHIPSMPMTAADDELVWAQRHVAHLRRIALSALPPPAGSETVPT